MAQIRQDLSYYQNKKRNKSWNFQNEQKANPITTRTTKSQTTDWIDIKPSTSKSTSKYDHSRPEKFEFPDLPPESGLCKSLWWGLKQHRKSLHISAYSATRTRNRKFF